MGQVKRFGISNDDYNTSEKNKSNKSTYINMEDFSIIFGDKNSMGNDNSYRTAQHQQPSNDIHSFFNRLGYYNIYNILPTRKKMAALVIKISVFLANLFGVSLFFYWLLIDLAGIKIFLTSVGVLVYGGMKLYEKYLDIKTKKRKEEEAQERHKHLNSHNNKK
jgi:hypothetical protein